MSSKIRYVLRCYTKYTPGYHVYKGGDVFRYLEHLYGAPILRPIKFDELFNVFRAIQDKQAVKAKIALNLSIYRVKKHSKKAFNYEKELNGSNFLMRYPPKGLVRESAKLGWNFKYKVDFGGVNPVVRRLVQNRIPMIDPILDIDVPEPRDR